MDNELQIDALNSLIVINNDRIEGYKTANSETNETDLKMLFSTMVETSIECRKELVEEVTKLGGTPEEGTRITGKFFRVWMEVKAALTGNDRKMVLESCEFGEDAILAAYKKIMIGAYQDVSPTVENLLNKQYALLKADHAKIANLLDLIGNN